MRGKRSQGNTHMDYPLLQVPDGIRVHPEFSKHVWLVKLKNDPIEHSVAFGNLRGWLNQYAR